MKKTWILWGVSLVMAFAIGALAPAVRFAFTTASAEDRYGDLQNFTKVLNLVQQLKTAGKLREDQKLPCYISRTLETPCRATVSSSNAPVEKLSGDDIRIHY